MRLVTFVLLALVQTPLGLDRVVVAPPENRVTPAKVSLGRELFFDPVLSADRSLACASCHRPSLAFSDGRRVSVGVGGREGTRNTPAIVNRTYGRAFFWDGRIATLETQVLQPIVHPKEMGAELPTIVDRLRSDSGYARRFIAVFGRSPDTEGLSQALSSYVRTLTSGDSRYDRFAAGDATALTPQEQQGLQVFRGHGRCTVCHLGSNLTDEQFHNTGVAWRPDGDSTGAAPLAEPRDPGRFAITGAPADLGAFKTPTLREVAGTAPYMHDGSLATLEDVVDFYSDGGQANPSLDGRIQPLHLTAEEKAALVAFLRALSGEITEGGNSRADHRVPVVREP